jgi:hypothetical protein
MNRLLMSSLFRDYVVSVRPRGEPFRSRSMVFCLTGHHPVLSIGKNARRQGLKTTFALLCPRSPGLTPRSLFGYSIVDSLISGITFGPAYACLARSILCFAPDRIFKAISAHGLILALTIQVRDRSWSRFDPWVKKPASRFFVWFCNPMEYMEIINA